MSRINRGNALGAAVCAVVGCMLATMPETFGRRIPVPGLVDMAEPPFKEPESVRKGKGATRPDRNPTSAIIINECDWLWLSRNGLPVPTSKGAWSRSYRGGLPEQNRAA